MDIKQQIRELALSAGVGLPPEPDQCWIDAKVRCPYGTPEGQYLRRPGAFCHELWNVGDGCNVYHQHVEESELPDALKAQAVREHFDHAKTSLADELDSRAEELKQGSIERLAIELAAAVVKDKHLDRDILLDADLPM